VRLEHAMSLFSTPMPSSSAGSETPRHGRLSPRQAVVPLSKYEVIGSRYLTASIRFVYPSDRCRIADDAYCALQPHRGRPRAMPTEAPMTTRTLCVPRGLAASA
jgi:hypothetical protein